MYYHRAMRGGSHSFSTYKRSLRARLPELFLLMVLVGASTAQAQFTTTTSNGEITITGYTGPGGAVVIPDMINELPVTAIGDYAFSGLPNLTSITIPDGVVSIGQRAFQETNLSEATLPESLTTIGEGAFLDCPLSTLTIPHSIISIGDQAFQGPDLTSVTVPSNVISLGNYVFGGPSMTSITVDPANPFYSSTDGILFNKDQTTLLEYPNGKTESSYTIPTGVTSIGVEAFDDSENLTSITIPNTVTNIGEAAFDSCLGLASITIPGSVTSVGDDLFEACSNLKSATISNGLTSLGVGMFGSCHSLTHVTLPNNITSISNDAFFDCSSLTSFTIPTTVTTIGAGAFGLCPNLTSVTIPASVTTIGDQAFLGPGLVTALFLGNAPTMEASVFGEMASGFKVGYLSGAAGFTSPTWTDSSGDTYPAGTLGTFSNWEGFYNLTGVDAAMAMPLKDGVPNLLKYLYNINPTVPMSASDRAALPATNLVTVGNTPYLTITYRHSSLATDATVNVQASSDLQTWMPLTLVANPPTNPSTYSVQQEGTSGSDPILQIEVPYNGTNRFIRLNVTLP